ncbi:MAG: carbohydrate porin [Candidatus Omnitrophica bacterium]|nr:carbohydrate porin [Candidatus Omnitrophota bacterium]
MFKCFLKTFVLAVCFCMLCSFSPKNVCAEVTNEMLLEKIEQMDSRINELEGRLAVYENKEKGNQTKLSRVEKKIDGLDSKIKEERSSGIAPLVRGVEIGASATYVYQFTDKANGDDLSENSEDVGDASYSVDISLTKEFKNGTAFIATEAGEGAGVDDELSIFSTINADATGGDSNIGITEAWYEHRFVPLTVTVGKVAADVFMDSNEYANDETTQFLGSEFKHSSTIEFPDNSVGLIIGVSLSDTVTAEAILIDGNADWEDMFEDTFYGGQFTISPEIAGKAGNYRVFGWGSGRDHTKWNDSTAVQENSYGFGLSADQELTDIIGVFARYAWQNPEVYLNSESYSLEHSYSFGMQIVGEPWGRDEDVVGIAFGQIFPSDDYKAAGSNLKADSEGHIEFYYSYKVNNHLTISPDVQIVMNPYGSDATNGDDTIVIGGIRGQVDF